MNARDALAAVTITGLSLGLAWYLVTLPAAPQYPTAVRETVVVTETVPGPTVTVPGPTVTVPGPTRTVKVNRSTSRPVAGVLARIRQCESGGDYRAQNRTSSASGAYQFLDGTWRATTGLTGSAKDYPPAVQDAAARKLYAQRGTQPWNASRGCWG